MSLISVCGGLRENLVWEKPQKPLLVSFERIRLVLMAVFESAVSLHYSPRLSNSLKQLAHRHTFCRRIVLLGHWFSLCATNIHQLMWILIENSYVIESTACHVLQTWMTHIFTLAVSVKWSLCQCLSVLMILAQACSSWDKHLVWPLFPCHLQARLLTSGSDVCGCVWGGCHVYVCECITSIWAGVVWRGFFRRAVTDGQRNKSPLLPGSDNICKRGL